jgi:benzoyl-CoA reductase/2-hydroxyglutaryl-CoA dehydratase subunit BcrC/BadD/HgdB
MHSPDLISPDLIGAAPALEPLLRAASDPAAAVARISAAGGRVLGLQCRSIPEELPHALGLHPWRLWLKPEPPLRSSAFLQTFCCTWVQALLDQALGGSLRDLFGVVFSCNTCDSMQHLPDIWRRTVGAPGAGQICAVRFPARAEGCAARELLEKELDGLSRWLEQRTAERLVPSRLEASARLFNRIRGAFRGLQTLAAAGRVPYSLLHAASVGAQALDRQRVADLLDTALEQLSTAGPISVGGRARVMVVGGILDDPRLLLWLEARGAQCVDDDICALGPSFEAEADLDPTDALLDMAQRHLRRSPCPVTVGSAARRGESLLERAARHRASGVVFVPFRGCEPHGFDNVLLGRALSERSIPHLVLEVEPHLGNLGQLTTRLEAFVEMLSGEVG